MGKRTDEREAGLVTAEYAVTAVAACGLGTLLFKLLTGPDVIGLIMKLLTRALDVAF